MTTGLEERAIAAHTDDRIRPSHIALINHLHLTPLHTTTSNRRPHHSYSVLVLPVSRQHFGVGRQVREVDGALDAASDLFERGDLLVNEQVGEWGGGGVAVEGGEWGRVGRGWLVRRRG